MTTKKTSYIGDGVYVTDDGYQLWLAVNHHENKVVALDYQVCGELIRQMTRIMPVAAIQAVANSLSEIGVYHDQST